MHTHIHVDRQNYLPKECSAAIGYEDGQSVTPCGGLRFCSLCVKLTIPHISTRIYKCCTSGNLPGWTHLISMLCHSL